MATLFKSLEQNQKIDFFIKCQELMLKYHPSSSFIIRENTLTKALESFQDNINKYQGFYYTDENICVLWNHIFILDPKNTTKAITENAYKEPNPNFNAISIDFAVFSEIKHCLSFVKDNYAPRMKYVLFIRGGNPRIYEVENILKAIKF